MKNRIKNPTDAVTSAGLNKQTTNNTYKSALSERNCNKLRKEHGLSDATIKEAGLYTANAKELNKLIGAVQRQGYTIVPLKLYWKNGRAKLEIGLAKGKKQQDKRASVKARDWQRSKQRLLKKAQ